MQVSGGGVSAATKERGRFLRDSADTLQRLPYSLTLRTIAEGKKLWLREGGSLPDYGSMVVGRVELLRDGDWGGTIGSGDLLETRIGMGCQG